MFSNLGSGELVIIAVIIFFFFGGKKLKELAKGMGESSLELKRMKKEFDKAISNEDFDEEEPKEIIDKKSQES
jgi:sec-independent protein translocase protein TatA